MHPSCRWAAHTLESQSRQPADLGRYLPKHEDAPAPREPPLSPDLLSQDAIVNNTKTLCPSCATAVSERTLDRFGGVCRRCHKQPLGYRKQWIALAIITLVSAVAAVLMDQELASLESTGGTRRVHVFIAMCYRIAGRTGVMLFFGGTCIITSMLAIKAFRNVGLAKTRLAEAQRVGHSGK